MDVQCKIYEKHHNTIDSIWSIFQPSEWNEIPEIESCDSEDYDGSLLKMLKDLTVYDVKKLPDFISPFDKIFIKEVIFIIKNGNNYYLCESQGHEYIRFAIKINSLQFIKNYKRLIKLKDFL